MRNTQEQTAYILQLKKQRETIQSKRRKRLVFSAAAVCLVLVVGAIALMTNLISWPFQGCNFQSTSQPAIGGAMAGVCMFGYYRYNGNYYSPGAAEPGIQNNIEKCLYESFYQIKQVDPGKSIALFVNDYYWKLDYTFPDTVYYNGKPYLIDMNKAPDNFDEDIADPLGVSGQFMLFAVKDIDRSDEIAVKYGNGYNAAYQMLSIVNFNGKKYELEPDFISVISSDSTQKYLGKAGPYDAFDCGTDPAARGSDSILLKINDFQLATARAIAAPSADQPLPKSVYETVFEHFAAYGTVQYKGHGIYSISDGYFSDDAQRAYKNEIDKLLDTESMDGNFTYEIFQIKGVDPSKTILAMYNNVYVEYDYVFPDTITYNGASYSMDFSRTDDTVNGIRVIRGNAIGTADGYTVYAIKQVDPSLAVIADMHGSNGNGLISGTMTFYRNP